MVAIRLLFVDTLTFLIDFERDKLLDPYEVIKH